MSKNMTITFLGTTSGGGPTTTRNCSSLVVDALGDGSLWMFDCAEGTVRQFEQQPHRQSYTRLRMSQVSKIFITHMHADHTMGTLTFLRNALGIPKPTPDNGPPPNARPPKVEIFGPRGIRRMLRTLWNITHTHSEFSYAVHELLFPGEDPSVAAETDADADDADARNTSECVGRDIRCDEDGNWKSIVDVAPRRHQWGAIVDAGPIEHRGYIIREVPRDPLTAQSPTPRKLVILGDTYDPAKLIPLVHADPPFAAPLPPTAPGHTVRIPVSLLVHEATDAHMPRAVDPDQRTGRNRTAESVHLKTIARGHSTPAMAGAFAHAVGAQRMVLNHIGARFPAPDPRDTRSPQGRFRHECMRELERQAVDAWGSGPAPALTRPRVDAAWDYLVVAVPPNAPALPNEDGDGGDYRPRENEGWEDEEHDHRRERGHGHGHGRGGDRKRRFQSSSSRGEPRYGRGGGDRDGQREKRPRDGRQ